MAGDPRHHLFYRKRLHGPPTATFGRVVDDDAEEVFFTSDDFYVKEIRDEESGKITFEFQLFDYLKYARAQLEASTLILFNGGRYERETSEEKRTERPRAHWCITATKTGDAS